MAVTVREKELEKIFKALANRRRLAMLRYIKEHKEASVGEIAGHMKLSFKATSKHLALLVAADLLEKEQRSAQMFFSISPAMPDIARRALNS